MSTLVDGRDVALDDYLERIEQLYADVTTWCRDWSLNHSGRPTSINEERHGIYEAPVLVLTDLENQRLAELVPYGESVLGAHGRVDLLGVAGRREKLVYLLKGGPTLTTRIATGAHGETAERTQPLYRGVDTEGWYWVSAGSIRRAYRLNKEVFGDLLSAVTGDEFRA